MKLEVSRQILGKKKKTQKPNFVKIRPMGVELFHADRQTDMTKLIVAFRERAYKRDSQKIRVNEV